MAFRISPPADTPTLPFKVGARARVGRDIIDSEQTVRFSAGGEIKPTGRIKTVSLGDAGTFEVPRWIPFIGTTSFRVQGEAEGLDELGRPTNIHQVESAIVSKDDLHGSEVLKIDQLQASVSKRGYKHRAGERLIANKDHFNFRETVQLNDIPRYFDDESFALEFPNDESLPFTVIGFEVGLYENGVFLPKSSLSLIDRLKYANQGRKYERHYLIEGPFVDKWTYDARDGSYEVQNRTIFIPRNTVEQRFVLWPYANEKGNHNMKRRAA